MSDARSSITDGIKKRADDVHVFISYSHDDKELAECVRDELKKANPDRVTIYLDAYSIRSGERWDLSIISNLRAADWLIFIYTGRERRSYDYCGFEMGIFASAHNLDTSQDIAQSARLVCVHDTQDVPAMLSMVQNRQIVPYEAEDSPDSTKEREFDFYRDSPLAQLFEDFYQYPPDRPLRMNMLMREPGGDSRLREMPNIAKQIVDSVSILVTKFHEARKNDPVSEKFYQLRMEIDIRDTITQTATEISARSTVTAAQDTFNLIGLSPDPDRRGEIRTTWGQMRKSLANNNETSAWMDKIEDDILDAVNQRNLKSPETTFRAQDGQLYRPLLARQIIYGSGMRKVSVMFVRTLPRKFVGDETTSALLIGLILASRFRFSFIENLNNLLLLIGDTITDDEFKLGCRQLIYDVERMEQESSEFGMNSPDLLHQAFGPENYEIVNAFYGVWLPGKDDLFAALKGGVLDSSKSHRENIRQQVKAFANSISPYNKRFLEMALQKYTAYLRARLNATVTTPDGLSTAPDRRL
jgi:hypothetical protein